MLSTKVSQRAAASVCTSFAAVMAAQLLPGLQGELSSCCRAGRSTWDPRLLTQLSKLCLLQITKCPTSPTAEEAVQLGCDVPACADAVGSLSWVICEQEVPLLPSQAQVELRAQWPGRAREPLLVVIWYVCLSLRCCGKNQQSKS